MADRLSTLPDEVLCHILSFLPTKVTVATSVLSKRWQPLWLSVPILHFDEYQEKYAINTDPPVRFLRSVYAAMFKSDATQTLRRFTLRCRSSLCDPSDVITWVNAAIQRKVEYLDLSLPSEIFNLPSCILSCKTLVVLKLIGLTVGANAVSSVSFPSLKILHLKRLHFREHRDLTELLSGCSLLEDLLLYTRVDNFITVKEFQSFRRLVRADMVLAQTFMSLKWISNAEFLRMVEVLPSYGDIPAFNNLNHIELMLATYNWAWLLEVLKHCSKLQILVIYKNNIRSSTDTNWAYPQFAPECLSSHLRTFSFKGYKGLECELRFVRYILQNASVLRTMKIYSTQSSNLEAKLDMIKKISLCPRSSAKCELSFE